jgi:prepilin-type N-terminal cleavage/methylation domain-containing protein
MKEEKNQKLRLFSLRAWLGDRPSGQRGMTLIEILVIVAIIGVLSVAVFAGYSRQVSRSRDAQRKDHLEDIRIAFEDYYNDNACYPDLALLANCGSADLSPYLKTIPCDPQDDLPYKYFAFQGNVCRGYRVLVQLENTNDPHIASMGCDQTNGCYYDDTSYNFGIAMGGSVAGGDWDEEGAWVIGVDGVCAFYSEELLTEGDCPTEYQSYEACFAVSGCLGNCTEEQVPLYLRCER